MAIVRVLLLGAMMMAAVVAYPYPNYRDNAIDEDAIDLSSLGEDVFGLPKNSSGVKLSQWNPDTSQTNPEELGEYFQGDILFPPGSKRNGVRAESFRWPGGIVPYVIEGNYAAEHRQNIMEAIAQYHRLTCIRFVPYKGQKDYLAIGNRQTGCWSSVGRVGGRQDVNLQNPGCVTMVGTIIHELKHALGFFHEQSRPERDNFVTIHYGNIKHGEEYNFDKAKDTNNFGVGYDYGSVMHYSGHAFSANGQPTITAKVSGVTLGQRRELSKGDVQKVKEMYKCKPAGGLLSWIFGG
ncbi:hatching enzyme 1.2-like [Arctopsyche grandis]|uniref:hatching enzyme 1.2-like n=1 Tax=Arctopsyche grandis TaxID=121162 RepID=UPI00406D8B3F